MRYSFLVLTILLIGIASAQVGYNNPKLPRIEPREVNVVSINNNTVNVNNSNCWKGDCGGFRAQVNQNVNTTNSVLFNNVNATNNFSSNYYTGSSNVKYHSSKNTSIMGFTQTGKETGLNFVWQNASATNVWVDVIGLNSLNVISYFVDFKMASDSAFRFGNNNDYKLGFDSTQRRFFAISQLNGTNALRNNPGLSINSEGWVSISEVKHRTVHNATVPLDVNGTILSRTYINASRDVCLAGNRCLNNTAGMSAQPIQNNTLLYWNNNTKVWTQLPTPVNSQFLAYCDTGGLQWLNIGSVCTL